MTTPVRRVGRARFRVQREEHATRARNLLEDALRAASLEDEDRVLIVRSLRLGQLPLQAGATTWSLRLEDRMRQLRSQAVDPDSPAAARAHVVCFPGRHEPWLRLALRTARGQPCNEWFWARATPGWTPEFPAAATLRLAFTRLAAAGGLSVTIALAHRLRESKSLAPLLDALQPADVASQYPSDPQATAPPVVPRDDAEEFAAMASAQPAWVRARIAGWGPDDRRSWWLAAVALTSARPAAPLPTGAEARGLARQLCRLHRSSVSGDHAHRDLAATGPGVPAAAADEPAPTETGLPPAYPDRAPTMAGGLFFLLPLLARGGLVEWLVHHPAAAAAGLPWRILHLALRHARTPDNDPLAARLPVPAPTLRAGFAWRRLLEAQRTSRRLTRVPLCALIARPALVSLTGTHIDVFFRATEADVRIRRAGLDLDPGWVPWLRRVVSFHFNREE